MATTEGKKASTESDNSVVVPSPLLNVNSFISNIYNMVDDPANHRLVSWRPMNSGFIVKDEKEFTRVLLPKYFRHNRFSSFLRQLYYYVCHFSVYLMFFQLYLVYISHKCVFWGEGYFLCCLFLN